MIGINDLAEELADDEFIRGIYLSQPFKAMTNNELTIEQLQGIAGGLKVQIDNSRYMGRNLGAAGLICLPSCDAENFSTFLPTVGYLAGLGDICA